MMTFEKIKGRFDYYVKQYKHGRATAINPRLKGACIGALDQYAGGTQGRYAITKALTGETSSKGLGEAQWFAIMQMVDPHKEGSPGEETWVGRENLQEIVDVILEHVGPVPEQLPLLGNETDIPWDDVIEKVVSEAFKEQ